jgi:hypothetical protein
MAGSLALCAVGASDASITALGGWQRAKWWASPLLFWDDFASDGRLGPEAGDRNGVGSICCQREIDGGRTADYTFLIAWHFPNRTPAWCGWAAPAGEENTVIGNHYCRRFAGAWQAADYVAGNLDRLEKHTRLAVMRESTLPAPVKEAAWLICRPW